MIFSPPDLKSSAQWSGMRVGLLGGSFNPPHEGHLHISLIALRALKLDCIWWLVTPQNPLKDKAENSFNKRFAMCEDLITTPKIIVSDLERQLKTNLSWQTIRAMRLHFPCTDFVWITGMDNAQTIHKWHNWKDILSNVATAHIARPPAYNLIENCPLRLLSSQNHVFLEKAQKVSLRPHNTYWLMQKKMVSFSSTEIRKIALKQ